jgi:thiol-disulfide isomerase/thioredoxin
MMRRLLLPLALLVTIATGAVAQTACTSKSAEASCSSAKECLPDVAYEGLNKEIYPRANLQGKVVVVNFWATWCGPCKKEIPAFNAIYEQYKDRGVIMLGVLFDNQVDDAGLLNFMSDFIMTYPVVRADRKVLEAYEYPRALPTTFVYNPAGKLVTQHVGPMSEGDLRALLDHELAK